MAEDSGLARRLAPYAPALAVSSLIGIVSTHEIRALAGEPAVPLDDSFIHFQFARRLAEGHFFSYVAGEGYVSGATSFLWPILLAPFHLIGFRGVSIIYAAWILGLVAHAALAVETFRLAERLAGRAAAFGAAAMCLFFGAFTWFAWSGMETVPLAWILMRCVRASAAYCEPSPRLRPTDAREVILLGLLAPLVRPEGAIGSILAAIALFLGRRGGALRSSPRWMAAIPLLGPLLIPLLNLALLGHAASSTTMVKWLLANPTYDGGQVLASFASNLRLLFSNILDGGDWTSVFLPERAILPLLFGAVALPFAAARRRVPVHGLFVAIVALGTLLPCTYLSFLWNRVRYIWPFAGAWFVLVACFAREAGDLVRRFRPRLTFVTPILAGACAGALAMKLPWSIHDLAQSARAIDKQQVALGRWAADHLPADARIGVNDTGAIAYLSGRSTFDVVGLTTEGEARYWVSGAGSRFEHYEATPRAKLPTHFIVYPQWMACEPVLGKELTSATVTDQSILGGVTMIAYEARYDALGTGALPAAPPEGRLVDEVDVADLTSEKVHAYDASGASDQDNQVTQVGAYDAEREEPKPGIADGGRVHRSIDRFTARLPEGKSTRMLMRVSADNAVELAIAVNDREVAKVPIAPGPWVEPAVDLPAIGGNAVITVRALRGEGTESEAPTFGSYHYWFYAK